MNTSVKNFDTSRRPWRLRTLWKIALLASVLVVASLSWHVGFPTDDQNKDSGTFLNRQTVPKEVSNKEEEAKNGGSTKKEASKVNGKEDSDSRLKRLKSDRRLPLVYFDVAIKGRKVGRIEMVLFTDISPRCAHNFHLLVTGEAGNVPPGLEGEGTPLHFKGAPFYRIIDGFIDQAGINTPSALNHGQFDDDEGGLRLKHEYKGLLSMANMGPDTNTAHFSIMINPAPHLDGHYTIFGQVVSGLEVVDEINALSRGKPENTATAEEGAIIDDCGELRKGTLKPQLGMDR